MRKSFTHTIVPTSEDDNDELQTYSDGQGEASNTRSMSVLSIGVLLGAICSIVILAVMIHVSALVDFAVRIVRNATALHRAQPIES